MQNVWNARQALCDDGMRAGPGLASQPTEDRPEITGIR
jgi:hypothetical protein